MSDMSDYDNDSALSPGTDHEYEEYDYYDYEVKSQTSSDSGDEDYSQDGDRTNDENTSDSEASDSLVSDPEPDEGAAPVGDSQLVDLKKLQLCSSHGPGLMTHDCQICYEALSRISDSDTVKMLTANAGKSDLVQRYSGRCDEVSATLSLSQSTIQIAQNVFTKGIFRDKECWQNIVTKYLTLPSDQHELLSADIRTENILNKYRNERRFQQAFKYQGELISSLENMRICQRPLFSLVEDTNAGIDALESVGADVGLVFSDDPPVRAGALVPRGGRVVTDKLAIISDEDLFPVTDIGAMCSSAKLSSAQAGIVLQFIENYRAGVVSEYTSLFKMFATHLNKSDDQLLFYMDLYSHIDGSFRDIIRQMVSSIFRTDIRENVLNQSSSRSLVSKPLGLFGGKTFFVLHYEFNYL